MILCFFIFRAHNKIDKLDNVSLENLPIMKILDMNQNKLVFLEDNTFSPSIHLQILLVSHKVLMKNNVFNLIKFFFFFRNLNNNLISNISANCLNTLTNLVELKMSHNRLKNLPNGLFKKLGTLELL